MAPMQHVDNPRHGRPSTLALLAGGMLALQFLSGCAPASHETPQQIFDRTVRQYHLPSAAAHGAERDGLLARAAAGYQDVIKREREESRLGAAALRSLGNVRAEQGCVDEAVRLYARVASRYDRYDWEVLQAWKSAADVLAEAGRKEEAREFYRKIVGRFRSDPSPMIHTVALAAERRLESSAVEIPCQRPTL